MDAIYLDESGLYMCRLCMFHGKGDGCYHLPPMMRDHNRDVRRRMRDRTDEGEGPAAGERDLR